MCWQIFPQPRSSLNTGAAVGITGISGVWGLWGLFLGNYGMHRLEAARGLGWTDIVWLPL